MFPAGPVDRSGGRWPSAFRGGKYVLPAALPPPSSWPGNGSREPPGKTSRQSGRARARRASERERERRRRRRTRGEAVSARPTSGREKLEENRPGGSLCLCVCASVSSPIKESERMRVFAQGSVRRVCVRAAPPGRRETRSHIAVHSVCVCVWLRTVASRGQGGFRAGGGGKRGSLKGERCWCPVFTGGRGLRGGRGRHV